MSDEPITPPAVQEVINAIQENRGTPDFAPPARVTPGATFNTATGTFEFHSEDDRRRAELNAALNAVNPDTMDDRSLQHEMAQMADMLATEGAKLEAHTFDPVTGEKIFTLPEGGESRRIQRDKVNQLAQTFMYQRGRYQDAITAREARDAARDRGNDAAASEEAWIGGDPERRRILQEEKLRYEAKQIAEISTRTRLGKL